MAIAALAVVRLFAFDDAAATHLGRGYDALKLERYEQAAAEFRSAVQLDPGLGERARFPLAVSLFQMKKTAEAREEFESLRRAAGDHPNILYYLGRLDLMDESFDAAIRKLTVAAAKPPFPDTAYHLGFAYFKKGDLASAEKWFKIAAQADPANSAVPYQLGMLYKREGREEEAGKLLALSSEMRRRDAEDSQLRHECEQKLNEGKRDEARAVCGRLYDPENAERLTALGTLYGQHGDLEAALGPLRRAADLEPQSPQMQYNLAFTYYELNRFEEARAPIAKAVERWPDIFQLNSLYGAVLLKLKDPGAALLVLRRAHQLNPEDKRTSALLDQAEAEAAAGHHSVP